MAHKSDPEKQSELSSNKKKLNRYWSELKQALEDEEQFRKDGDIVVDRYRDERDDRNTESKFNILWANTETLKPAFFSSTPQPDIRRRFKADDDEARKASLVLERGILYSIDAYDFTDVGESALLDYLLPGRGEVRLRYDPTFVDRENILQLRRDPERGFVNLDGEPVEIGEDRVEQGEDGGLFAREKVQELVHEEVKTEYVYWKDLVIQKARRWEDVDLVWFRHWMNRDQLIETFGEGKGNRVQMSGTGQKGKNELDLDDRSPPREEYFPVVEVWECWDRATREVVWFTEGLRDEFLAKGPDPLELERFFPMPKPLLSIRTNESLTPRPEFMMYEDQAHELDDLTERLSVLTKALKVSGVYDQAMGKTMDQLVDGEDNVMIPVDNWAMVAEKGGLKGVMDFFPIEEVAKVTRELQAQRQVVTQTIFEITGISDIQRGRTDPRETRGAQELKAQFGGRRLLPRTQQVERFFREIYEIKAEIMARHFMEDTLTRITGMELDRGTMELLRSDMRNFRIDIETESTVAPEREQEKQEVMQLFEVIRNTFAAMAPFVQTGLMPIGIAKSMMLFALRRFKVSREIEDLIKNLGEGMQETGQGPDQQEQGPSPAEQAKAEALMAETKAKIQREQAEMERKQAREDQLAKAKIQREREAFEREQARQDALNQARIAEERARAAEARQQANETEETS